MKNQSVEEHSWLELLKAKTEDYEELEESFLNSDRKSQTMNIEETGKDLLGKFETCLTEKKITGEDFQKKTLNRFDEYERRRRDKLVNQKKEQLMKEMQEYTLTPKINEDGNGNRHESLLNRLDQIIETRKANRETKKEEYLDKEELALRECTFSPRISINAKGMKRSIQDLFDWNNKKNKKLVDKGLKKFEAQKGKRNFTPKISKKSQMMMKKRRKNGKDKVKVEDRLMRYLEKKKKNREEAIKVKENEFRNKSPRRLSSRRPSSNRGRRSASMKTNRAFQLRCESSKRKLLDVDQFNYNSRTSNKSRANSSMLSRLNSTFLTKSTIFNKGIPVSSVKGEQGPENTPDVSLVHNEEQTQEEGSSQLLFSFRKNRSDFSASSGQTSEYKFSEAESSKKKMANFKKKKIPKNVSNTTSVRRKAKARLRKKSRGQNKENSFLDTSKHQNSIRSRASHSKKNNSLIEATPLRRKPSKKEINKKYSKRKISNNVKRKLEESISVSNGTSLMLDNLTKINNKLKFMNSIKPQNGELKSSDGISNLNTQSQLSSSCYTMNSISKGHMNENIFIKNMENLHSKGHSDSLRSSLPSKNEDRNPFIELCVGFNAVDVECVRDGY